MGRNSPLRSDWDDFRIPLMRSLLLAKFGDPSLQAQLLETRPRTLIEGNTWYDTFWGVDAQTGAGENNLGKLLMEIRDVRFSHSR